MAEFVCPVVELSVSEHPDADLLEVAQVGGYECVIRKGQFESGDQAVYLPEASVLPESLLDELGLTGRLAGKQANRVKAIRLRGVLSQGVLVPLGSRHLADAGSVSVGDDLREHLGITKYVPEIPVHMQGIVEPFSESASFDVEPWQAHVGVFRDEDLVQVTEKLHGTFCEMGFDLKHGPFVASKSMAGKTRFVLDAPENDTNLYVRAWREAADKIEIAARAEGRSLTLCGEIAGPKVQDLNYGLAAPTFFVFDALTGTASERRWMPPDDVWEMAAALGLEHVPVLKDGWLFDHEAVQHLATQPSVLGAGLREGVVVRSSEVRWERDLGRAMLKYVNPAYLTRRGGTDHN